ncbi:LapD/MoxY N-terminal periplasmic domain-containing protein [Sulfurimonas sp.]|uniref:LapD/MoxY N-terminal periplasmic domain-containing protein n=1 Tax=Sulfurimonas sp. TaxID=2022749 RepID=UPI0035672ECB
MTLFRQIAILLSIFLIILLSTVLFLNFKNASKSVSQRLYEDAKNTATSLSLSLAGAKGDISMMSIMIDANFDSGHYGYISLVDLDDELLHERKAHNDMPNVPAWFLNAIDLQAPIALANVSAGWNPIGILNVQSNVSYAYTQLYEILKSLFISFSILSTIGLFVLNFVLIVILKPLKKVQLQAEAVVRNEFVVEDTDIFTKEFRDVVVGMNTMVIKAKAMFDKGNKALQKQKELEYTDKVTKLKNRKYFMHKAQEYLTVDSSSKGGINIIIEISGLIEANDVIGRENVNKMLCDIADVLRDYSSQHQHAIVTRMNPVEFSILIPDLSYEDGVILVDGIDSFIQDIVQEYDLEPSEVYVAIGLSEYSYKDKIGVLLARADSALTHSKYLKNNKYLQKVENTSEIMSKDEWKSVIVNAIEKNNFSLTTWDIVDTENQKDIYKSIYFMIKTDDGTTYSYDEFMLHANQLELSNSIYKNILNMIFTKPDTKLSGSVCSLKLSYDYVMHDDTYNDMKNLFSIYASNLPFKLIIELPDKLLHTNSQEIKQYKALFDKYSIDIGIVDFIGESTDYQYLQDFRPVYIKADKNYFIDQNEHILSALRLITDSAGISLIATGVSNMTTLDALNKKDIYMIQGEVTKTTKL